MDIFCAFFEIIAHPCREMPFNLNADHLYMHSVIFNTLQIKKRIRSLQNRPANLGRKFNILKGLDFQLLFCNGNRLLCNRTHFIFISIFL